MMIHIYWAISHTVDRTIPKKWAIVLYSQGVARHHNVVATTSRCSTEMAFHMVVSCLHSAVENCWQRYVKVSSLIRKISIQSLNVLKTI